MLTSSKDNKKPRTRSLGLVLLAWIFIGGQALLAGGSVYNYREASQVADQKGAPQQQDSKVPWALMGQGATKVRMVATQARPDVIGNVGIFLAVANALGLAALVCALLSWSRSSHTSGKLTMAAAIAVILVNSILNLPYA
jgi:hypothetical protein